MATHRYWRIYLTSGVGSSLSLDEIEMSVDYSGPDLCSGGTASASSSAFGSVPANAFDNSISWWHASSTTNEWIEYDFGLGNDVEINCVRIRPRDGLPVQAPKTFTIQYSDNDVDWFDQFTETDIIDWTDTLFHIFFTGSSGLDPYEAPTWRLSITAVDGGNQSSVAEMEYKETSIGSDLCAGGLAFGTDHFGGFGPDEAFDDSTATAFASTSIAADLGYVLPSPEIIREITIQPRATLPDRAPKDFTLDYSIDNVNWVEALSVTGETGWTELEIRTFTTNAPAAGITITVPVGDITVTGYEPVVSMSDNILVTLGVGEIIMAGFAPIIKVGEVINMLSVDIIITGYAPTVINPISIPLPAGTIQVLGKTYKATVWGTPPVFEVEDPIERVIDSGLDHNPCGFWGRPDFPKWAFTEQPNLPIPYHKDPTKAEVCGHWHKPEEKELVVNIYGVFFSRDEIWAMTFNLSSKKLTWLAYYIDEARNDIGTLLLIDDFLLTVSIDSIGEHRLVRLEGYADRSTGQLILRDYTYGAIDNDMENPSNGHLIDAPSINRIFYIQASTGAIVEFNRTTLERLRRAYSGRVVGVDNDRLTLDYPNTWWGPPSAYPYGEFWDTWYTRIPDDINDGPLAIVGMGVPFSNNATWHHGFFHRGYIFVSHWVSPGSNIVRIDPSDFSIVNGYTTGVATQWPIRMIPIDDFIYCSSGTISATINKIRINDMTHSDSLTLPDGRFVGSNGGDLIETGHGIVAVTATYVSSPGSIYLINPNGMSIISSKEASHGNSQRIAYINEDYVAVGWNSGCDIYSLPDLNLVASLGVLGELQGSSQMEIVTKITEKGSGLQDIILADHDPTWPFTK